MTGWNDIAAAVVSKGRATARTMAKTEDPLDREKNREEGEQDVFLMDDVLPGCAHLVILEKAMVINVDSL